MARKRNQGSKWIRKDKRLAIYLRDGQCCAYCGQCLEDGIILTLDHIVPCELGGENKAKNLVTACLSCNSSKRDLPLNDFLAVLRDRGVDTSEIPSEIQGRVARDLKKFRTMAKAILANR